MVVAVFYLLALASAVESGASGPAAVVDWTRGATSGVSTSAGPVATIVSLEEAEYTTAILNVTYWDADTNSTKSESKEIGKYGEGRVGPVSGVLVHVGPEDDRGCALPLTQDPPPSEPWIALIRRGECNFDVKVDNAYKSNAAGVIIFDIKNSSNLEKMKLSPQRNISAVLTTKWKGEELARLVDNGTRVYVQITIGNHCLRPYGNINSSSSVEGHPARRLCHRSASYSPLYSTTRKAQFKMSLSFCDPRAPSRRCLIATSVLFVSISFIVLMIISLAWLVFYYIQRFRYIHAKDRLARRLCNAAKKALSKIPTKHIKSEDREIQGEGECCAVCIEPYKVSDVIRILPCKHEFHKSCIDPWLLEHRTCPMCKMDILKYYGFTFTGSQESILHIDMDDAVLGSSDSHEQPSPALVAVGASGLISDSNHSRGQSNPLANSQSESEDQVPSSDMVNCRAPSPDEFTPTLGLGPCTLMVVSELDTAPSNSLTSFEKGSKSSNKDDMLQKDGQADDNVSCDRISLNSEKFPVTTLVKDSDNELDPKPVHDSCSESCGLPECERGEGSDRRQQ